MYISVGALKSHHSKYDEISAGNERIQLMYVQTDRWTLCKLWFELSYRQRIVSHFHLQHLILFSHISFTDFHLLPSFFFTSFITSLFSSPFSLHPHSLLHIIIVILKHRPLIIINNPSVFHPFFFYY